jgi:hypothetical protein
MAPNDFWIFLSCAAQPARDSIEMQNWIPWMGEETWRYPAYCRAKWQIATGTGRKPMIYSPQEYQILIDLVEKGYGLVTVMHQINEYREEEHLPDVGLSTTCRTMNRLRPVIIRVKRRKQGNRNPDSPWAKARLRCVT